MTSSHCFCAASGLSSLTMSITAQLSYFKVSLRNGLVGWNFKDRKSSTGAKRRDNYLRIIWQSRHYTQYSYSQYDGPAIYRRNEKVGY